jgi:CTP:molybdopterin cytidylyltransferase MocA
MVETLRRAGMSRPAVVVGADGERVSEEARRSGATPLPNPDYRAGRFTSVRIAARWALEQEAPEPGRALLLWPVDCPGVGARTLSALRDAAREHPGANIVPTFAGRGGHPVVLCSETLAEILSAPDDASLRDLILRAPAGRICVAVDDGAVLDNLNTRADYEIFLRAAREVHVDG